MSVQLNPTSAATLALPFDTPRSVAVPPGKTIAEIVVSMVEEGVLTIGIAPHVIVFVGDQEIERERWPVYRPAPGALLSLRVRPGVEQLAMWAFQMLINIAVSTAVAAVVKAFTPDPSNAAEGQVYDIGGASNEVARYAPIGVPLGKIRVFPRHASRAYTMAEGEKVFLFVLLCWGLGPIDLDELKIGDTPLSSFAGVTAQHRLKPSDPWPTIFPSSPDEADGPGLIDVADGWVQRTTEASNADELQVEVLHTEGLIRIKSDGTDDSVSVEYRIRYRAVGDTTWLSFATGSASTEGALYSRTGRQRKPYRETHKRTVTRGQYEVAFKRVTADPTHPNVRNQIAWSKLRTFTYEKAVSDDNLAVTALKIEAGDQLNGVIDLVNGVVTRRAPIWNAGTETWGAEGPTQNPAELARWIATGPGNPKPRGSDARDDAALGAWAELCTARDWRCDMELRQGASLEEIQQTVARCGRAILGERAGKLTPIIDDVQPIARQLFTPRNSWGFRMTRRFQRPVHAFRIEFANEEKDYERDEMLVFFPGYTEETAELIETLTSVGKTRPVEVFRDGRRAIAERILRQADYSWRADIENLASARGQRVALQHFVMAVGKQSARVQARVLNGGGTHVTKLVLDETVEQITGDTYGLKWRKVDGAEISVETLAVTNVGVTTNEITLTASVPLASAPNVGDVVTFGDGGIETIDVVLQDIARASSFEAELAGLRYTGDLFSDDDTALPAWSSNVSGGSLPRPAAPVVQSTIADATGIYAAFDFAPTAGALIDSIEAYWRRDEDATFELVTTLGAAERVAAFPPGVGGVDYELKLVAVGRIGGRAVRTASAVVTVTSAGRGQALTGNLTLPSVVIATDAAGNGGDFGAAAGEFKLYRGDLDISDGSDADIGTSYAVASASPGLTISINADTGLYSVSALTVDQGTAVLRASNNGETLDLTFAITKAKAALTERGDYNAATTYYRNEWVRDSGGSYVCRVDSVTGQAPSGTAQANAYWDVLAAPGAPGEPGTPPSAFTATIDLANSSTGLNLRTIADAAGYTGLSDATITFEVESGIAITGLAGAPNGGIAIDTGTWPTTEYAITLTLTIKSGGIVRGGGGRGGAGGGVSAAQGGVGGDAIYCRVPITININSGATVQGAGGGGGGGGRGRVFLSGDPMVAGGGGGGGGRPNGPGGAGGVGNDPPASDGEAGTTATTSANGVHGDGGVNAGASGANGGDGGNYGANGNAGGSTSYATGGGAGAAGYCVRKNGHTVPVTNSGTTAGTIG